MERQSPEWEERQMVMRSIMRRCWGREDETFREIFSLTMLPEGTVEQWRWLTDLQRVSASAENAIRFVETSGSINVVDLLPRLRVPTLVLHARGDQRVPYEEGRLVASSIPGARFVTLESRNHLLCEEPAWLRCHQEIVDFLAT
jgi:pimeloyl-ACP methyl ester carboxylesterase